MINYFLYQFPWESWSFTSTLPVVWFITLRFSFFQAFNLWSCKMIKDIFKSYRCSHCEIFKVYFPHFSVPCIKTLRPILNILYGHVLHVKLKENVNKTRIRWIRLAASVFTKRQLLLWTEITFCSSKPDVTISMISLTFAFSLFISKCFISALDTNNKLI